MCQVAESLEDDGNVPVARGRLGGLGLTAELPEPRSLTCKSMAVAPGPSVDQCGGVCWDGAWVSGATLNK